MGAEGVHPGGGDVSVVLKRLTCYPERTVGPCAGGCRRRRDVLRRITQQPCGRRARPHTALSR